MDAKLLLLEGNTNEGALIHHVVDVTQKPGSVILMEVPRQGNSEAGNKYPLTTIKVTPS